MQPTPSDVHVNGPLSNVSVAFIQQPNDFVAARIFPNVPVSKQSDVYYSWDRGHFNRSQMKERAPATKSQGSGFTATPDKTYYCRRYSLHHDIPDEVRANADAALDLDRSSTIFLTTQALLQREKLFVANFFASGLWTFDLTGVASNPTGSQRLKWSDAASDPVVDVRNAKREQRRLTGYEANKLVLGRAVFDTLLDHPDVLDRIKYGQTAGGPAIANKQTLAALFEVDTIEVMNSIENTAEEGVANAHSFIGGNHALLVHAAPAPGLMVPTAGYTFSWTGMFGNSAEGTRIKSWRPEGIDADRIEIDMCTDMRLVAPDLGTFWSGIV